MSTFKIYGYLQPELDRPITGRVITTIDQTYGGSIFGSTGPTGSVGVTGPTGPAGSGGGGSNIQYGTGTIVCHDFYKSYTGTIPFTTSFSSNPVVTANTSIGSVNLTDISTNNFSCYSSADYLGTEDMIVSLDSAGNVGTFSNAIIVNGNPAVVYRDTTNSYLKYIRANDISGTSWGIPVIIDTTANCGYYCKIIIINGNPAVVHVNNSATKQLIYVRSNDVNGTTWGTPVTVFSGSNGINYPSILIANGNPAISFGVGTLNEIRYIRSNDIDGNTWGSSVLVDTLSGSHQYLTSEIVNGAPAIVYNMTGISPYLLKYAYANDINGTTWSNIIIRSTTQSASVNSPRIYITNGYPNIIFQGYGSNAPRIVSVKSNNISGTSWGTTFTSISGLVSASSINAYSYSVCKINNKPAIAASIGTSQYTFQYIISKDSDGTSWNDDPVYLHKYTTNILGNNGDVTLFVVNGNTAVVYYDTTNGDLMYMRANTLESLVNYIAIAP